MFRFIRFGRRRSFSTFIFSLRISILIFFALWIPLNEQDRRCCDKDDQTGVEKLNPSRLSPQSDYAFNHSHFSLILQNLIKSDSLTAWDRRCIPLHLRASWLNNWRTSCQNLMKTLMVSLMIVLTLIPKSQKSSTIEWRSAPDMFSPILQRAAFFDCKTLSTHFFFLFSKVFMYWIVKSKNSINIEIIKY